MFGAFYLLGKKSIFIETELSHDMILCVNSVPRPNLNFSHQRKTMPRHSFCLFYGAEAQSHKNCHITICTRKLGLKGAKTKGANHSSLLGLLGEPCGCARAWILVEIELGFEVLKRFELHILVLLLHSPSLTFV